MSGAIERAVLITGAGSGIGAAIAAALAGPGVGFLLHTRRNAAGLAAVAARVEGMGAAVETMLGDLGDPGLATALVGRAREGFGRLDVVVSNAGFADRTPIEGLSDAAFAASFTAIAAAFLALVREATSLLRAGDNARVIAVSSFVAHSFRTDLPAFPASAAAKAGLEALVRALALELAPAAVTVNAVVPGFIRKDQGARAALDPELFRRQQEKIPLGRLGTASDVAALVAFLASPAAGYITGQAIHVDGGLVITP